MMTICSKPFEQRSTRQSGVPVVSLLVTTLVAWAAVASATAQARAEDFQQRRQHLLEMLSDPSLFPVRHKSATAKVQARRWQFYHASLAQGMRINEANAFFASLEVQRDEWLTLMLLNTYCEFEEQLTPAAKERMREIILRFSEGLEHRELNAITKVNNENHILNWKVIYLLAEQEFGMGDAAHRNQALDSFKQWVQYRIQRGMEEFNSPHYLSCSLHPLLLMYDYYDDASIKEWAHIGIDAMLGNYALLSLNNVRGGPYFRTIFTDEFSEVAPRDEHRNGLDDRLYEVGYLYFGNCPPPSYRKNDGHYLPPCVTTTSYRLPQVLYDLATDKEARGRYEVKLRRRDRFGKIYNLYYYITPDYSLGSMQNRVELDNYHSGYAKKNIDHWNNQVWELTFAAPRKILGPKRYLRTMSVEKENPNTANMQYENVLFFKGRFLDYNANLTDNGGSYFNEKHGDKQLHFWRIPTDNGNVFAAATEYPEKQAGILEVCMETDFSNFDAFRDAIRQAESHCEETGLLTRYVSTGGDEIFYDHGASTVNGKPFSLENYPTMESPYASSCWDEGVMEFAINGNSLRLDARDVTRPKRLIRNHSN